MCARMAGKAAPDHADNVVGAFDAVSRRPASVSWVRLPAHRDLTAPDGGRPDAPLPDRLAHAIAGTRAECRAALFADGATAAITLEEP